MCSKHVEARNKLIVKQKICATSWLITEINIGAASRLYYGINVQLHTSQKKKLYRFNVCHPLCVKTNTSTQQSVYTQHFIMVI